MRDSSDNWKRPRWVDPFVLVFTGMWFLGVLVMPDADGWFVLGRMAGSVLVALGVACNGRGS